MFEGNQHLHDPEKAAEFARALGLMVGGHHPFVGDWQVKGLYAYRSGKYKGQAYFGTGGSESDRLKDTYDPIKPGESNQKYRPWNRDDPKIPEDIRLKLIRLEDRMNRSRQPSAKTLSKDMLRGENILVSKHSLPKYNGIYTIQTNEINGKPWYKNNSGCMLYFYNANSGGGASWSLDDRSQDGTNDWFRGGWIEPPNSGGPPLGIRRWEDAGTIKMESVSISDEDSSHVTPLKTGWYQMEHADGSLLERVRVHRDERNTSATNEFIATGDHTGDVMWYVEGNIVKVPKFGSTGTIQADGNIIWDLDGGKAVYKGNSGEPVLNSDSGMLQGEISLKGVHGKYLSATPEGRVLWNSDVANVGEYFRVEQRQNGKIALRGPFDMYVSAQPDGSVQINRREAPPGGWEEFTVEYRSNDVVCLKSYHGKYLTAQKNGPWDWTMRQEADAQDIQIEPYRKTHEPVLSEPILNSEDKYVFAEEHKGWHWHNERARAMGGHIASITSAKEDEDIIRISGGAPVWLGGIRKGDRYRGKPIADRKPGDPGDVAPGPEDWYWSDGRPWSYTNWGPGEPNNWDGGENRVQHLGKLGAVWNDVGEDWEGPAVYRIPAKSTPPSAIVPRYQSTGTVKLNPGISDEAGAEPNKRLANITFVIGITLFIFGLPLVIIGAISTAEDRLAMLVPGAIIMSMGVFVLMRALFIFIDSGSKSYVEINKQTQIKVLSFNHKQPVRFTIDNPPLGKSAWVGIYPAGADNRDHGDRWFWLKDIDVNDASLPGQAKGAWSIRVFSDRWYTLHERIDFELLDNDKSEVWMHDARYEDRRLIGQVHYGISNEFTRKVTTDSVQSHSKAENVNRFETKNTVYLVYEDELVNDFDDEPFWKV